jgi:hypothetical protein
MPEKLLIDFEIALQIFHVAGGSEVTAIRAPTEVLQEFLRGFPALGSRYLGISVELAPTQSYVSIRGQTIAGHALEVPGPSE